MNTIIQRPWEALPKFIVQLDDDPACRALLEADDRAAGELGRAVADLVFPQLIALRIAEGNLPLTVAAGLAKDGRQMLWRGFARMAGDPECSEEMRAVGHAGLKVLDAGPTRKAALAELGRVAQLAREAETKGTKHAKPDTD